MNKLHTGTLKSYRPNLFFILGLAGAISLAAWTETSQDEFTFLASSDDIVATDTTPLLLSEHRPLTSSEIQAAHTAWSYIESNTNWSTGLVNSVDGYPSTTLWEIGSYIFALIASEKLSITDPNEFDRRTNLLLGSLGRIDLFEGLLPNKAYHTQTLEMVTYENEISIDGLGWSALDVMRCLLALQALVETNPQYRPQVQQLVSRWDLTALSSSGRLVGADRETDDGSIRFVQEGRIGYEQYGARTAMRLGLDAASAASANSIVDWNEQFGHNVPIDRRSAKKFGAINPTLSEPYILMGLELGWDNESEILASHIYRSMEARFLNTGKLTMLSEDHINQNPYFLYGSLYSNGREWAVVDEDGVDHSELRTVSLKASFGWHALFDTDYTASALDQLAELYSPQKGWMAGQYEQDNRANDIFSLNSNAVVLEAIHYRQFGPFLTPNNL
ncbi:MAG: DUF3131 domain-containing protein [Pseudoruegeria sp.]